MVEIFKRFLDTPISNVWGSASRAQRPLPTGSVRRQFPSFRGTRWRNNGSPSYFKWRILAFTRLNWKCHVIILIKTHLSGFVVTMHSGLCDHYVKSLDQWASSFGFLFRTCPRALVRHTLQNPSVSLNYDLIQCSLKNLLRWLGVTKTDGHLCGGLFICICCSSHNNRETRWTPRRRHVQMPLIERFTLC